MRKYSSLFWYVALFLLVFTTDRATKFFALVHQFSRYTVTSFLRFHLTFNRGVSWGMFSSNNFFVFLLVSIFITIITLLIILYGYQRYRAGYSVFGEILVVAGSVSNIIDRAVYGGVIDFIAVSLGKYSWPVFNVADVAIVLGVFIICVDILRSK